MKKTKLWWAAGTTSSPQQKTFAPRRLGGPEALRHGENKINGFYLSRRFPRCVPNQGMDIFSFLFSGRKMRTRKF